MNSLLLGVSVVLAIILLIILVFSYSSIKRSIIQDDWEREVCNVADGIYYSLLLGRNFNIKILEELSEKLKGTKYESEVIKDYLKNPDSVTKTELEDELYKIRLSSI